MNKKSIALLMGIFNSWPTWAVPAEYFPPMPSFAANQGALSYSFFNLSPTTCTLTPEGAGGNAAAYSTWGQSNGWMNAGDYNAPGLFNPNGVPFWFNASANGTGSIPVVITKGTSDYFTSSYVFFDWPDSPLLSSPASKTLLSGQNYSGVTYSAAVNNISWNTPAIGDSWSISCLYAAPTATSNISSAVASLASTQNALVSATTQYMYIDPNNGATYQSYYYFYPSYPGWFYNSDINPVAEGNPSGPSQPCYGGVQSDGYGSPMVANCGRIGFVSDQMCVSNPQDFTNPDPNSSGWPANPNPCGAGFTSASPQIGSMSLNWNVQESNTGGLWSGINYSGLNNFSATNPYPAVYNINMPMLPINLSAYAAPNTTNPNPAQLNPPINWTPIMGGQFTYAIGDPFVVSSFAAKILAYLATSPIPLNNASNLASISYTLTSSTKPVFATGSTANEYVQWLMGSQSSSQNYQGVSQTAANTYASIYNAANNNTKTEKSIWGTVFKVLADTAIAVSSEALKAAFPEGAVTTALVGGVTVEGTGVLIDQTNSAIDSAYSKTTNPTQPLSQNAPAVINPTYSSTDLLGLLLTNAGVQSAINSTMNLMGNPDPLFSNYTIYTGTTTGSSTENPCTPSSISVVSGFMNGTCGSTTNQVNPVGTPPTYNNVFPGAGIKPVTNALSIWTAILTGSNIIPNPEGWFVLGDSADGSAPFQPPFQLYSPTAPSFLPSGSTNPGVTITFNPMTFVLTAQSITWNPPSVSSGKVCTAQSDAISGSSPTTCEYSFQSSPPTLNYMQCVSDPQATGGVIATFSESGSSISSSNVSLACACIPSYLGGPVPEANAPLQFLTGASSTNPSGSCSSPP